MDTMHTYIKQNKRHIALVIISFLMGAAWLIALRFVTFEADNVHYHANYAVYVDGEQLPLDSPLLYEEVQACGDGGITPKGRVHMHNAESHIVHVHDDAATWGHFFANIGFTAGDTLFRIESEVYTTDTAALSYVLNGQRVTSIANRVIGDEDVLLVSIDTQSQDVTDDVLNEQFATIPTDAGVYNGQYDPSGCSGATELSVWERLRQSVL